MTKPLKTLFAAAALISLLVLCGCTEAAVPTLAELEDAAYTALNSDETGEFKSAFLSAEQAFPSGLKSELYRAFIDGCGGDMSDPQVMSAYMTLFERGELGADELIRLASAYLDGGDPRPARDMLELAARCGAESAAGEILARVSVDISLEDEGTAELIKAVCADVAGEDLASLVLRAADTGWLGAVMPSYDGGVRRYTCEGAEVTASVSGGVPVTEIRSGSALAARVTPDTAAIVRCERAGGSYEGPAHIQLFNLSSGVYYTIDCTFEGGLLSGDASFGVYTLPEGETPAERLAALPQEPDATYSGSFAGGVPDVRQRASADTVTVGYNSGKTYYLNLDVPEGLSKDDGVSAAWLYLPEA